MNEVLILAAGAQERFNYPIPKGLCPLKSGECLISRMCRQFRSAGVMRIHIVAATWWGRQYRAAVKQWIDRSLFIDSPCVGESIRGGICLCRDNNPLIVSADTFAPEGGWSSTPAGYDPKRNITIWSYPRSLYENHDVRTFHSRVDYTISVGRPVLLLDLVGWYNINTQSDWREMNRDYNMGTTGSS